MNLYHKDSPHNILILKTPNQLLVKNKIYPCTSGRGGIKADKQEGDGATPCGTFPLRRVYYRPDRVARPLTALPCEALSRTDGWCDDPADIVYNKPVTLPYGGRHEELWRDDHVYDVIVEVGYNDDPIIPGKGSAIFIHLVNESNTPTQGCIALSYDDLMEILAGIEEGTCLVVPETLGAEKIEQNPLSSFDYGPTSLRSG
jgi:L,D-peptidoglycan transpeptidase YkuD (ErfK/YbiS/YcfS/YnhG family)